MTVLSVVIPAYNEEKGIVEIASRVLSVQAALRQVGVQGIELLVVDDGSRDRTADVAERLPGVCLIRHAKNKGYGAALKTGFSRASGELIGFLDADGTYPPEYFPKLCQAALDGADLVIGSRMAGEDSRMPLTRRVGNFFFAHLLTLLSRQKVTDSASGMRVFRREVLEHMYPLPDGLNLTPVMSTRAIHEGMRIREIPIPYSERVGRSKLHVVRDGGVFMQSMLWTALSYNPVRILGLLGLGSLGMASIVFLWIAYLRLNDVTTLGPWGVAALFLALISTITGVNLLALGITFNYLVALFYKKPIPQGLFGKPIFRTPLDKQFGWMGLAAMLVGPALALSVLLLGGSSWEIGRLWFYMVGSALIFLVGVQLSIYWLLLRILEELSQRELLVKQDVGVGAA